MRLNLLLKRYYPFIGLLVLPLILSDCTVSKTKNYPIESYSSRESQLRAKIDSLETSLNQIKSKLKERKYEPGKAYVKCSVATIFETVKSSTSYPIYTGSNFNQKGIQNEIIEVKPSYSEWIKVKSSEMCEAYSELDDKKCEVWYLKEIENEKDTIYVVVDTNRIKDYEVKFIDIQKVVKEAKLTPESEMGCPLIIETNLIRKVQNALRRHGYSLIDAKENTMDRITKEALVEFQKANNLPIGTIDFETLNALGIKR